MNANADALRRAIERVGSAKKLADALDISPPAIAQWNEVPVKRVLDVERISGVSRHELRPDIYGPQPEPEASAA
jgi:DNA-binding transcriptional regulator YdaS (Cro superfamily)